MGFSITNHPAIAVPQWLWKPPGPPGHLRPGIKMRKDQAKASGDAPYNCLSNRMTIFPDPAGFMAMVWGIITYSKLFGEVTGELDNVGPSVSKSSTLPLFGVPHDVKSAAVPVWLVPDVVGPGTEPLGVNWLENHGPTIKSAELSSNFYQTCMFIYIYVRVYVCMYVCM